MIVYLIIIILIILVYCRYNTENFNNYKSVLIIPNKLVYNPPKINTNNTSISQYIANFIVKHFPIKKQEYKLSNYDIINKSNNSISITTLYDFLRYSENNDNSYKFIFHLFNQQLTIISKNRNYKNLSELNNKDIYIYSKNSAEFYILNKLKSYYGYNIKLFSSNFDIYNLINVFNKKTYITNIAFFTSHPDKVLENFIKKYNYPILNVDNIKQNSLKNIITNFKTDKIESNLYYKYRTDMINTIVNPIVLICDEAVDNKFVENIIEYIYKNFIQVKNTDNKLISDMIRYFNLYDIFASETDLYDIHPGITNFYKKYGYITNKDLNICRKVVSINSCSDNKYRLNPYRLL